MKLSILSIFFKSLSLKRIRDRLGVFSASKIVLVNDYRFKSHQDLCLPCPLHAVCVFIFSTALWKI